jgi:two-component system invasion response regulator UvrY
MLNEYWQPCVVDEAESEDEAIALTKTKIYDLVLLDINIPNTNTIELLKYLLIIRPQLKVIIFSMNAEKMHAKRYLDVGAHGFLSKDASIDEIKRAINMVLNNRKYYSENFIDSFFSKKNNEISTNPFERLTEREFEIVSMFLQGKTLTEISELLSIQRSTTGTHKAKIFEKLNINNLVELIELASIYKLDK